jgi:hypothetical protein
MRRNASRGCDFTSTKMIETNNNENTKPPNWNNIDALPDRVLFIMFPLC